MKLLVIGSDALRHAAELQGALAGALVRGEEVDVAACVVQLDSALSLTGFFKRAQEIVSAKLGGECDLILITFSSEKDSPHALFTLTSALRPFQTRVYLGLSDLNSALEKAEGAAAVEERIILLTSLAFFQMRICTPLSNPVLALKLLLVRNRPFGLPLAFSVLKTDDYVAGALQRRDATLQVNKMRSRDLNQALIITQRFRTQFQSLQWVV